MAGVRLYEHQKQALEKIHSGSILYGGVGTGKSITALSYFFIKECGGRISDDGELTPPKNPKKLFIITTARKRDTFEWNLECEKLLLSTNKDLDIFGIEVVIDSWNNIGKYENVYDDAFYIFDEQRVVGSGSWVKSFIRISKIHHWILLSATPGDTWMDYIPVFIANGFYRNRTEFLRRHAVYNRYSKYPKVDKWIDTRHLEELRNEVLVPMEFHKHTISHRIDIPCGYNPDLMDAVCKNRWNPYNDEPIRDISNACYLMRKVVNSDPSRLQAVKDIFEKFRKVIVFYNYNYELDILRGLSEITIIAEWNGTKHEPIPETDDWIYLVQYTAGSEGWNCTKTNAVVFYSQSYSYKQMTQAAGRIDRLNTPFVDLYYYTFKSGAPIDISIGRALRGKKNFNENAFAESFGFARKTSH